jgi:hypothetical protein
MDPFPPNLRDRSHPERCVPLFFCRLTIAGMILLTAVTGCGGPRRDITGQWRAAGDANAIVWDFSENGAVKMGSMRGRYSFGDRDRIKIETPSGTAVYQIELSGDRMTLTDPRGSRLEFTKAK